MMLLKNIGKELKIVYTPLHGTGITLVPKILKELGFSNLYIVNEQEKPDGNFPTVNYPNPEEPKAFKLALDLAKKVDADVVLATDPDADRLGVYSKDVKTGDYKSFTGNMSGLLIAEYILSQKKEKNLLSKKGALIKTIVSSNMAVDMAKEYNIKLVEVLTGFKYIGEQIKLFEENKSYEFIFGFEESYGCLMGTYARDKDAIAAVMAICEVACYAKSVGKTLYDIMLDMYNKYGYYKEDLFSFTLKGKDGSLKINHIMNKLRETPLINISNNKVLEVHDYLVGKKINVLNNNIEKLDMPASNVLYYKLENDSWFCIRPSGTEPKIKIYLGVKRNSIEESSNTLLEIKQQLVNKLESML